LKKIKKTFTLAAVAVEVDANIDLFSDFSKFGNGVCTRNKNETSQNFIYCIGAILFSSQTRL
jgi:hypothetical protein